MDGQMDGQMEGWGTSGEPDLARLFARLPEGWSEVDVEGRRWGAIMARSGSSRRLTARRLDDGRTVGANLYLTSHGPVMRPCEVSARDVVDFLGALEVVGPRPATTTPLRRVEGLRAHWALWRMRRRTARSTRRD